MKSFSSFTFFHQSFSMPGKLSFDWFGSIIWRLSEGFFFLWFCGRFQVKKKKFFHNFLTIMSFGVIGVFISTTIISFGTWWVFPKLGFEGLTARDYLGEILFIFVFLPAYIYMFIKTCFFDHLLFESECFFSFDSAIGTIFSSTDTVCTLQVLDFFSF